MAFQLKDGQKVGGVKLRARDGEGNEAQIDGAPSWSSSDEALATVAADPNDTSGKTAIVTTAPGAGVGIVTVTASADADLGEGVVPISGTFDFEVIPGDASVIEIAVEGTPEPRDTPPA